VSAASDQHESAAATAHRVVLYVAYFFPPLGGGGVQRTVKFLKYLRPHGWRGEVVTVRAREYWVADDSLAADVPDDTTVWRTRALTGLTLLHWLRRRRRAAPPAAAAAGAASGPRSATLFRRLRWLSSWCLIPDAYIGWLPFAWAAVRRRLRTGGIEVLITTSSPDTAHLIGLLARRRFAVPWVADFRDPWVRRITFRAPTPLHRRLHAWLESRVLHRADRILVTNAATRDDFLARHPTVPAARFVVIPNGFDPADVALLAASPPAAATPPAPLRLLHAGLLAGERTLAPITAALSQLFATHADWRGRLQLEQLGPRERINDRLVAAAQLSEVVSFKPPVTHDAVLRAMRAADALVLLEVGDARGALITPGKIFEYLASGRPILAVVPEGPAAALVREMRAGEVVSPAETDAIAAVLARWITAGPPVSGVSAAALRPYERPQLAAKLAAVLAELGGGDAAGRD
jgi:glycosyltransferase involved in cell wall biosynthesis